MNKEDFFIKQISNSKYIGDDGAFIDGFVYSMDTFFENVHFKKNWMSLEQIAYKSMIVNISDAIVMNAKPKYALLSVAIPKYYSNEDLKNLSKGFKKACKEFGVKIIGGDTIENEKLDISITIVSKTSKPIFRSRIKNEDLVCYTGTLGSSKQDLNRLFKNEKISKKSKFIKPILKADFFYDISKYVNAAIDISDGLFLDLEKLSLSSKVGFEFFENITKNIATSAEEYEILFTFSEKYKEKIEKIAKKYKVKLNIFAKAVNGRFKVQYKNHHFKN